ncbi:MAG: lspA [Actinomycetia bacterium]|nr:lspA [Actinomycetes bacterium]
MREVQERRPVPALIAVAAAVVAADHLTKWLALRELTTRDIHLVGSLRLHLVFNNGSAFGLGSKFAPVIALMAVGIVVSLLGVGRELRGRVPLVAIAAIVGGAVGNLLDRVFRHGSGFLGGPVVDFVDLQWWPVFNVADMAITCGAVALALTIGRESTT